MDLTYEADLLGNIQQALAGLQGFDVMALELIQNADDAGAEVLTFDVRDKALLVRNNARFSTCGLHTKRCPWEQTNGPDGLIRPCNFHAISRMGSRSKVHAGEQIGRFGIGFISVYQITDTPIIRSAGIEMHLVPLRGEASVATVADAGGTEFELPWAALPSQTRSALNASPTPSEVTALLLAAIAGVMAQGLLFLRHLERVELQQNGRLVRSVDVDREGKFVTLDMMPEARVERWMLVTRDANDVATDRNIFADFPILGQLDRSQIVQVAVPLSDHSVSGLLYAYLPTEQSSGMPLHINGDFFPHPNRRSIVLSGEQHERYWNELLLDTAAKAIGEAFEELRDLLGGHKLWKLGNAAFELREKNGFREFWKVFSHVAKATPSALTVGGEWRKPAECYLSPEEVTDAEQTALTNVGLQLAHPDLRPFWTVLSSVGLTPLRLLNVVRALELRGRDPEISLADPDLKPLWRAIDFMIGSTPSFRGLEEVLTRLKETTFLLDVRAVPASINELWRLPQGVSAEEIRSFVPNCPLVHEEVTRHPAILDVIDIYNFDKFAADVAESIVDESRATIVIGNNAIAVRRFYDLLTAFDIEPNTMQAGAILADVPMLWSSNGFVPPSRGQLPGGFIDPVGHFALIDLVPMSEQMYQLARTVLNVPVLTFKNYVEDHLDDILSAGPTREQYVALLREILDHRAELDADDGLEPLSERLFIRTRGGNYSRPDECYYHSQALEILLGDDGNRWVDEEWMPPGRAGARFRDLLESRLGMPVTVAARHIVDRIEAIAESSTVDDIATRTTPIVRHTLDRFSRFDADDRRQLERLRSIAFIPGLIRGERDNGHRYTPTQVYRAFRAAGFLSQVAVVDLAPLRGGAGGSALIEFLDLIGMPDVPPTEKVVAHLEYCMEAGLPASDTTYAILYERLDAPDAGCMDRLAGRSYIYDSELERYLPADKVFWIPPPFGGRWYAASSRMRQREALYRRLGVENDPSAKNYAALLLEIASSERPSQDDITIHSRCLAWLADALDSASSDVDEVVQNLIDEYALINLQGTPVWTADAVWVDSEWLAAPFGQALDERLVAPPSVQRASAGRLFRRIGVPPLSKIARFCLASPPSERPAREQTDRLRERADLLLWLAPTRLFREALRSILSRIEVRMTATLQVHAEITEFDPPVRSPVSSVAAFFDPERAVLFVRAKEGEAIDWSAAFRALFVQLESYVYGIEMPPVIMTAAFVTSLPSRREAEQALRNSEYHPPDEGGELPLGEALGDTPDDVPAVQAPDHGSENGTRSEKKQATGISNNDDVGPHGQDGQTIEAPSRVSGVAAQPGYRRPQGEKGASQSSPSQSEIVVGPIKAGENDPFKSRAANGSLGDDPSKANAADPEAGGSTNAFDDKGIGDGSRHLETATERQTRRSRMLTYVDTGSGDVGGMRRVGNDNETSKLIDVAAIAAVLNYERARGWLPEEQPHTNPGYDVISRSVVGPYRRLIEVKGLESEWTERGIKLTHVQYGMAEKHPDEFWIYVVENARTKERQRVNAIANPFSKVEEYWFDDKWKAISEETASAEELNIRVGARISHSLWKTGTIMAVERRGMAWMLTIDFGPIEGRRYIPYNSSLKFVD